MEKKIGKIVKQAGVKAGDAMGKAKDVVVQVVDQNGDGKLDLEDVKLVGEQVKHETKKIVDLAQEKMNAQKVKSLNPFYSSDLEKTNFPKLVQIVARAKNYDDNSLCKGSIGFMQIVFKTTNYRFIQMNIIVFIMWIQVMRDCILL